MRQRRRHRGREPRVPDRALRSIAFALHLLDRPRIVILYIIIIISYHIAHCVCKTEGTTQPTAAVVGSEHGNTTRVARWSTDLCGKLTTPRPWISTTPRSSPGP